MSYEQLIAALLAEGEAKRNEILGRARAEAERLIAQAAADAEALERQEERQVRDALAARRVEALSRASMDRRRRLLHAKHEVLDAVWRRATEIALALSGQERARVLQRLLDELLDAAPPGPLTVIIDPRERPHLAPYLTSRNLAVEERSRDDLLLGAEVVAAGAILRASLTTRLAKARPQLLVELNQLLFAEQQGIGDRQGAMGKHPG
jgi:vacuolar-type H+-ATPase subunit E/Vma4